MTVLNARMLKQRLVFAEQDFASLGLTPSTSGTGSAVRDALGIKMEAGANNDVASLHYADPPWTLQRINRIDCLFRPSNLASGIPFSFGVGVSHQDNPDDIFPHFLLQVDGDGAVVSYRESATIVHTHLFPMALTSGTWYRARWQFWQHTLGVSPPGKSRGYQAQVSLNDTRGFEKRLNPPDFSLDGHGWQDTLITPLMHLRNGSGGAGSTEIMLSEFGWEQRNQVD